MKNIILIVLAFQLTVLHSCKKEELKVVDVPVEIDENSPEYQGYLAERAMQFIRMYRFEKLGDLMEKIQDAAVKSNLGDSLVVYRAKAKLEGLYYVTAANDSLYFVDPNMALNAATRTILYLDFSNQPAYLVNAKGVLHGFAHFPNASSMEVINSMATGLKQLETMPELQTLTWNYEQSKFEEWYPTEVFEPSLFAADLSGNTKLHQVSLTGVDIAPVVFPKQQLTQLYLNNSRVNTNSNLNTVNAEQVQIDNPIAAGPELALEASAINSLRINYGAFTTIDVSKSKLESLTLNYLDKLEKLTLNPELTTLKVEMLMYDNDYRGSLTQLNSIPAGIRSLFLSTRRLDNQDFSGFRQLDYLRLEGAVQAYNQLQLPTGLQTLYLVQGTKDQLDLSAASQLTELYLASFKVAAATIQAPASIERLSLYGAGDITTLDLSHVLNLKLLSLSNNPSLMEVKLPNNLQEQDFAANFSRLTVKRGCVFINAPEWLTNYIYYFD
ncbi:MAG: hypothetical protein P0Y53_12645 [Candidatus Pseudobacter hemicellulosilyticus]|uniref:Leucine-rich repeat domain-containing protein n=1 Tax=Candidatus Pseudobacter hemicellulosilyticus TaxID=3121375 RepID=A0AAJ5WXG6_9BACT|nr:MAG: hypothetical protein P0Y53_12645 [Pseudobacter sp.]